MTPKPSISIHALLAESDDSNKYTQEDYQQFLSTLSLRRATLAKVLHLLELLGFLSTLSLRRATFHFKKTAIVKGFLSTLSLRRATRMALVENLPETISIHALLAESDITHTKRSRNMKNFYPRSPCGERRGNHGIPAA